MTSQADPELDWYVAVRGPRGQSLDGFIERATPRRAASWILHDAQVQFKEPKGPGWVVVCEHKQKGATNQMWSFTTDEAGELEEGTVFTPRH